MNSGRGSWPTSDLALAVIIIASRDDGSVPDAWSYPMRESVSSTTVSTREVILVWSTG